MKVCICGGTNPATNAKWIDFADELGDMLCANDIEMVWGGNSFGTLSRVHKKYLDTQKSNTLVMPRAYEKDLDSMETDKVIKTERVSERTDKMFSLADAVLVIPGGIGTIYEFWSAVEQKRANEFDIDIVLFNYNGFFNHQLEHYKFINENGFTKIGKGGAPYTIDPADLFKTANTAKEVVDELIKIKKRRGL